MLVKNPPALNKRQQRLDKQQQQRLYRQRRVINSAPGPRVIIDGHQYLSFCSNDYLGLANNKSIVAAYKQALDHFGCGSGASPLVSGYHHEHQQLEEALAEFTGFQRCLLFANGYVANLAMLTTLLKKQDTIFIDRNNHASIQQGANYSPAKMVRYQHNDFIQLDRLLQQSSAEQKLIYTDAVFSMDGDVADVSTLTTLAKQHSASVIIDDAHGFGVLGESGRGSLEHCNIAPQQVEAMMATFGKALGCYGAFVAADDELIETLIQFARPYIYSTAMPAAMAAAVRTSLQIVQRESWRREKLRYLINYFRLVAAQCGLNIMPSTTAIQGLIIGPVDSALQISDALLERGIYVPAMRPPTVAVNSSRLRITLSALHTEEHIDQLLTTIADVMKHD